MKLILHPGHAKCGSTSIQNFLRLNRKVLFENKVLIPDINLRFFGEKDIMPQTESPRLYFRRLMETWREDEFEDHLNHIRAKYPGYNLVLSAENLTNMLGPNGNGRKIHEVLSRYFDDIVLIYYIKPQDQFLLSAWQQWGYKQGLSLEDYIFQSLRNGTPNYLAIIKYFEQIYSRKYISIRPLYSEFLRGGDLIKDFVHRTGLPDLNYRKAGSNSNKSLNPFICKALSQHPVLFRDVHDERVKKQLEDTVDREWLYARFDEILPVNKRKEILEFFNKGNSYIQENYFPEYSLDKVFASHIDGYSSKDSSIDRETLEIRGYDTVSASILNKESIPKKTLVHNKAQEEFSQQSSGGNNQSTDVKLVAIAKDEGPYLLDWIHHHLYFGFKKIHIYVNRTTDNSILILNEVSARNPNVTYETFDWLDICDKEVKERLQTIAYSHAISNSKAENDCSHMLFLDLDEYWISKDFKSTIQDCILELERPDVISFEWVMQKGEDKPFQPIPNVLKFDMGLFVKTLLRIDVPIKRMTVHKPIFKKNVKHILANGSVFVPRDRSKQGGIIKGLSSFKKYSILHRMYKSEIEYLSSLYRGNPEGTSEIKLNRSGFIKPDINSSLHEFSHKAYDDYLTSLSRFKSGFEDLETQAIKYSQDRVDRLLDALDELSVKHPEQLLKVFSGVTNQRVSNILRAIESRKEE